MQRLRDLVEQLWQGTVKDAMLARSLWGNGLYLPGPTNVSSP